MGTRLAALSIAVFAAVTGASVSTQAQTAAAAAPATEPYDVPRTSWGDPDLQGVWDYRTITPMERRPELGDRAFYTEEEVAQLEGRASRPSLQAFLPNLDLTGERGQCEWTVRAAAGARVTLAARHDRAGRVSVGLTLA
jgi:hypothetical protein